MTNMSTGPTGYLRCNRRYNNYCYLYSNYNYNIVTITAAIYIVIKIDYNIIDEITFKEICVITLVCILCFAANWSTANRCNWLPISTIIADLYSVISRVNTYIY